VQSPDSAWPDLLHEFALRTDQNACRCGLGTGRRRSPCRSAASRVRCGSRGVAPSATEWVVLVPGWQRLALDQQQDYPLIGVRNDQIPSSFKSASAERCRLPLARSAARMSAGDHGSHAATFVDGLRRHLPHARPRRCSYAAPLHRRQPTRSADPRVRAIVSVTTLRNSKDQTVIHARIL
jgi:hypothetical protein